MSLTDDAGRPPASLQAGRDYPRTHREFLQMFVDPDACSAYLEGLRWPRGFVCPSCSAAGSAWRQTRGRLVCSRCRRQTTATASTILDKTRTPLTTWFEAAWLVTTAKNGLSAKTLERTLGVSYRTAWAILHRFRIAMVRAEREPLHGEVEVDETLVGGAETGGKRGRGTDKEVVVIAVEVLQPKGFGRVRMRRVLSAEGEQLVPFVRESVAQGSEVHTDGWLGYSALSRHGFQHRVTNISASGDPAHVTMPAVHRVASLLKRWILGTHQGSFTGHHLQAYLEEFTFRFDRRTSRSRGLVFRRLVEQTVATGPITAAELAHGYDWPGQGAASRAAPAQAPWRAALTSSRKKCHRVESRADVGTRRRFSNSRGNRRGRFGAKAPRCLDTLRKEYR